MQDNRTLSEMKFDDEGQLDQAYRYARRYRLPNEQAAHRFTGQCLFVAMNRLGVQVHKHMDHRMVDRLMETNEDRRRSYPDEKDAHRRGLYVYKKDGEMAYFISDIITEKPSPFAINRRQTWDILTNVPVSVNGQMFSAPGQVVGAMKGNMGSLK